MRSLKEQACSYEQVIKKVEDKNEKKRNQKINR